MYAWWQWMMKNDDGDEWWQWLIYFELFLPGCPGSQRCQPSQVAGQVAGWSEVEAKELELFVTFSFWIVEQQLSAALQQSASRETSSGSWKYLLSALDKISSGVSCVEFEWVSHQVLSKTERTSSISSCCTHLSWREEIFFFFKSLRSDSVF